nr:hypothetical protein [Tanacetum cinerariifolium]
RGGGVDCGSPEVAEKWRHVTESDLGDRIDRSEGNNFGFAGKSPPEKFSGGGSLRNSSNPRQQATIHDGRVIVQPVQGRKSSFAAGTSETKANFSRTGWNNLGQSTQTMHMLMKPQVCYDNNLKQALGFQNLFYLKKAQLIRPMLYDGSVIFKETNVISLADFEETLMLEDESLSKMLLKQSDPIEKKVIIKPINYVELN